MNKYLSLSLIGSLALTSCFKDEPANTECDITEAYIHIDNPMDIFFDKTDTLVKVLYTDSVIFFDNVRLKADLSALSPRFNITKGATISPASGTTHDFSTDDVTYTVTSEDGQWQRRYSVAFIRTIHTTKDTVEYNFENVSLDSKYQKYYVWQEQHEDGNMYSDWSSGNEGFRPTNSKAKPEDYPTACLEEGYEGKGVKLVTRSTGSFGDMVHMPLAAGNLFIGEFDFSSAFTNARKATTFGKPFDKRPVMFSGYYKYKPGEKFQNKDKSIVEGKVDKAAIYAILYRNKDDNGNAVKLDGDNVQTSQQIVAKAIVPDNDILTTDEWTKFEIPFTEVQNFDQEIADNQGYSLTIVFSSSTDGAYFQGAIGSTLCIDNVRIVCESVE